MSAAADAEDDAAAADLLASIDRRLSSLQEWSLVELAQCRGPLPLHAELAEQVNSDLAVVDGLVEDLALLAEQHSSPRRRAELVDQCSQRSSKLERLRSKVRDAALASRRRIQASTASSMRSELFSSNPAAHARSSKSETHASKDDELMSATSNVTDGLRRTRQLMEQELERSVLSTQMLERSSQTLTLTSNQYTSFSDILTTSKKLITALEKADVLDRLLITAALIFFFLVCILIIKRRIIDRGVRAVSLVGKVAGGVGGVANRGVKAIAPREASDKLTESAASLVQSVTTALASVGTATAGLSSTSLLSSSAPLTTAASAPTARLHDSSVSASKEAATRTESTTVPLPIRTRQTDIAISASSDGGAADATPLYTLETSEEELASENSAQIVASDLNDPTTVYDADASSSEDAWDIDGDAGNQKRSTATAIGSEDAMLASPTDGGRQSQEEDSDILQDLEADPEAEVSAPLGDADVNEDAEGYQPADEHIEDVIHAVVDHDEL